LRLVGSRQGAIRMSRLESPTEALFLLPLHPEAPRPWDGLRCGGDGEEDDEDLDEDLDEDEDEDLDEDEDDEEDEDEDLDDEDLDDLDEDEEDDEDA
jgi:hypothetical protein